MINWRIRLNHVIENKPCKLPESQFDMVEMLLGGKVLQHWHQFKSQVTGLPILGVLDKDEEESSEEDDGQSNLQKLATAMRDSHGDGSIRALMKRLIQCQFLIGPSTHGYYSCERAKASRYEHERLELIHPDLVPGYKPDEDSGMMRRFY